MKLKKPFNGSFPITQRYGENPGDYSRQCLADGSHNGVDWAMPEGTAIFAAANGVVERAEVDATGYGLHVRIRHDGNITTICAHLRQVNVRQGMAVLEGGLIGFSGNTGNSTGPHLHFEVRKGPGMPSCSDAVDPEEYLEGDAPPEPGAPVVGVGQAEVIVDSLNIRLAPGGTDVGDLVRGMRVEVTGEPVTANGVTWVPARLWIAAVDGEGTPCLK